MMANAATAATKDLVSKRRSLPTPSWEPVQPNIAKGPAIQAQFPWESTQHTSGCYSFLLASATTGTIHTAQL